jgi:hypothetical protein
LSVVAVFMAVPQQECGESAGGFQDILGTPSFQKGECA